MLTKYQRFGVNKVRSWQSACNRTAEKINNKWESGQTNIKFWKITEIRKEEKSILVLFAVNLREIQTRLYNQYTKANDNLKGWWTKITHKVEKKGNCHQQFYSVYFVSYHGCFQSLVFQTWRKWIIREKKISREKPKDFWIVNEEEANLGSSPAWETLILFQVAFTRIMHGTTPPPNFCYFPVFTSEMSIQGK